MTNLEKIIFWVIVIWWIGQLMGCATGEPNCVYPNQHSWCTEKSVCDDEPDRLKRTECVIGERVIDRGLDRK